MKKLLTGSLLLLLLFAFSGVAGAVSYKVVGRADDTLHSFITSGWNPTWNFATKLTIETDQGKTLFAYGLNPDRDNPYFGSWATYQQKDASAVLGAEKLGFITELISYLTPKISSDSRYDTLLQFCIWEAVVDGIDNFDPRGNNFMLYGNANYSWYVDAMNGIKSGMVAGNYQLLEIEYTIFSPDVGLFKKPQDLLVFDIKGPAPSVPVPGAVWLLGSGLAGIAALRRKAA